MDSLEQKRARLEQAIADLESTAVAFSGGVDSTLLLVMAQNVLGDKAAGLTAVSRANPQGESREAADFCADRAIRHIAFPVDEFEIEGFEHNPPDRCYRCKLHLMREMMRRADAEGLAHVAEGSNADDATAFRPGNRALAELGIASPLRDAGLTKRDVRELSRQLGLPTWNKPSIACLYTRFEYGDLLTDRKIARVAEAERFLLESGYKTVRVRSTGPNGADARIEVDPSDITRMAAPDQRAAIIRQLKELGFVHVALDLQGYRTGSMDEALS